MTPRDEKDQRATAKARPSDTYGPRSLSTLRRIVESTRSLLAERGYDALSMRQVAAESGISVGLIYQHFPGKDALVDHVVNDTLREFELGQLRAIASLPVGSFERIAALGEVYIRLALENEHHFKVLFTRLRPTPRKLADIPGQGGYGILRQCLIEAMEAGTIRRADPDLATFFLWSRVHGIVMLFMACDFSDTLPIEAKNLNPLGLFKLTREFVVDGLLPASVRGDTSGESGR